MNRTPTAAAHALSVRPHRLDTLIDRGHLTPSGPDGTFTDDDVDHAARVLGWMDAGMPIAAAVQAASDDRPRPAR